jgi:hypothetical protein
MTLACGSGLWNPRQPADPSTRFPPGTVPVLDSRSTEILGVLDRAEVHGTHGTPLEMRSVHGANADGVPSFGV